MNPFRLWVLEAMFMAYEMGHYRALTAWFEMEALLVDPTYAPLWEIDWVEGAEDTGWLIVHKDVKLQ